MFGLKRFKIKLHYNEFVRPYLEILFKDIDNIIVQQQFTTSIKDFLLLCEIRWKKRVRNAGEKLAQLNSDIDVIDDIIEIRTDGKKTLCFVKGIHAEMYTELFSYLTKEFLCFIEYPMTAKEEYGFITIVGTPEDVKRLMSEMLNFGTVMEIKAVTNYNTRDRGILAVLTEKQQDILKEAYDRGFFANPRQTTARDVSKKLGIAHTTFLTHIRKSQDRIFSALFGD